MIMFKQNHWVFLFRIQHVIPKLSPILFIRNIFLCVCLFVLFICSFYLHIPFNIEVSKSIEIFCFCVSMRISLRISTINWSRQSWAKCIELFFCFCASTHILQAFRSQHESEQICWVFLFPIHHTISKPQTQKTKPHTLNIYSQTQISNIS